MKPNTPKIILSLLVLALVSMACQFGNAVTETSTPGADSTSAPDTTEAPSAPVSATQPYKIAGGFTATNSVFADYYEEHAVALIDMHGFVVRDQEWEIPVDSQVLGFMDVDEEALTATYSLFLPELPQGELNDVDNNGQTDTGVQVFAVSYSPNLYGGPYSEGDDRSEGWPGYLASVKADSENEYEIIGGKLVVWSPDANQQFPTGFGADGLLFTADDPAGPIPAGYSIVDLDASPFAVSQESEPELTLYEPKDVAIKDFADLSYTEAFDKMFEIISKEYAFNGIDGKQPDWDTLYAELKPRMEEAEKNKDPQAYYTVMRDFTRAFHDGHVGMSAGDYANEDFYAMTDGGFGFAIRELDDGRSLVNFVTQGGPAEKAGMKIGAELLEVNGKPVADAISEVVPFVISSSDFAQRYQQQRYLLRTKLGDEMTFTFANSGEQPQTVTLTSVNERESWSRSSVYYGVDSNGGLLPVEFKIIPQGGANIGYIILNSNYDDLNLLIRLFERALQEFEAREVAGIIIDMRYNSGGAPLGLAGFLTDKEIPTGQDEYYSDATGKFEPEGKPGKIIGNQNQYHFDKMVLLVGQTCFSACEFESYGFSQVPGMITVGQYPTAGVFAEVSRGQFSLPEDFSLQVPTGRTILPDGSIFLEGKGVPPTLRVPIDETTIYRTDDYVLEYGIRAVLQPLGAGITPAKQPTLLSTSAVEGALNSKTFEDKAREKYTNEDFLDTNKHFTYTVQLSKSETLLWVWGWCAKDQATLDDNLGKMKPSFTLNGQAISLDQFLKLDYDSSDGQKCTAYIAGIKDWSGGEHHAVTSVNFTAKLSDGTYDFTPGTQIFDYSIYVKP